MGIYKLINILSVVLLLIGAAILVYYSSTLQTEEPDQTEDTAVTEFENDSGWLYVGDKSEDLLHSISCGDLPQGNHREYFFTIDEARKSGYYNDHSKCMKKREHELKEKSEN